MPDSPAPRNAWGWWLTLLLLLAALLAAAVAVSLVRANAATSAAPEWRIEGARPEQGPRAAVKYGCGGCHVIPGVRGARGKVGPPLAGVAERSYLAGILPNTPENLIRWIQFPQALEPGTAMPDLNVTDADARDLAAYLYALR